MRRMINFSRENVFKMVSEVSFFAAILAALVLFSTAIVYVEPLGGKEYSVLNLLAGKNTKKVLADESLNVFGIFLDGNIGYMEIFAPIVASIPYISIVSCERMHSNFRFEIFRVGRTTYAFGNLLAAFIVGGFIFCVAYAAYGITLYVIFHGGLFHEGIIRGGIMREGIIRGGMGSVFMGENVTLIIKKLMGMFIYGGVSVIPTVLISAFVRNKYIVLFIPFMLNYFWNMFLSSVTIPFSTRYPMVHTIYDYLFPMKMKDILFVKSSCLITGLSIYALLGVVSGTIYDWWLKKGMEKGGI